MSADSLFFEAGGQLLVLPAQAVREVLRAVKVTPLPQAPRCVEGVINLRGAVTPVLNFRRLLGLPPQPVLPRHFLIVTADEQPLALLAETLRGLLPLPAEQVMKPPDELACTGCLAGVATTALGLALVLQTRGLIQAVWSVESTEATESIAVSATGGTND